MKLDGGASRVLLRDVQMHPFKNEILHVDFQRIDENRKMRMKVPLHFVNAESSPAVKLSGAIISHVHDRRSTSPACRRTCPSSSRSTCPSIEAGASIHVSALKLPQGVRIVPRGKLDPVVAAAVIPRGVESEEAAAETEAAPAVAEAPKPAAEPKAAEKEGRQEKGRQEEVDSALLPQRRARRCDTQAGPFAGRRRPCRPPGANPLSSPR